VGTGHNPSEVNFTKNKKAFSNPFVLLSDLIAT
jgi:hypothetical protein